jgi:hypothetical protein
MNIKMMREEQNVLLSKNRKARREETGKAIKAGTGSLE